MVTGGSRGIGRAIALGLAEAGADVLITYRERHDEADAVVREIDSKGRRAKAVPMDVTDRCQHRRGGDRGARASARSRSWSTMPASTSPPISIRSRTPTGISILDTNLKGPFLVAQAFLPLLKAGGRRHRSSISARSADNMAARAPPIMPRPRRG